MPRSLHRTVLWVVFLTATAGVGSAWADPVATSAWREKTHTGVIISVDPKEHVLWMKGWMFSKKEFSISDHCAYSFSYTELNNNGGTANDLRPGEKVTVSYQDREGIRLAYRIEQKPLQLTGTVKAVNPGTHTLVLHRGLCSRQVVIAPECAFLLRNDRVGTVTDLHPGDQVMVTYETPHGRPIAWQITKLH